MKKFNYALAQKRLMLAINAARLIYIVLRIANELMPLLSVAFNYSSKSTDYDDRKQMELQVRNQTWILGVYPYEKIHHQWLGNKIFY